MTNPTLLGSVLCILSIRCLHLIDKLFIIVVAMIMSLHPGPERSWTSSHNLPCPFRFNSKDTQFISLIRIPDPKPWVTSPKTFSQTRSYFLAILLILPIIISSTSKLRYPLRLNPHELLRPLLLFTIIGKSYLICTVVIHATYLNGKFRCQLAWTTWFKKSVS